MKDQVESVNRDATAQDGDGWPSLKDKVKSKVDEVPKKKEKAGL